MEHFLLHVKILLNLKSLGKAVCKCDLHERFFTLLKRSRVWIKRRSTRVILVGTPALPHTGDHKPLLLGTDEIDILIVTWCAFMLKHEDQNEVSFKMSIDEQEGRLLQYLIAILCDLGHTIQCSEEGEFKFIKIKLEGARKDRITLPVPVSPVIVSAILVCASYVHWPIHLGFKSWATPFAPLIERTISTMRDFDIVVASVIHPRADPELHHVLSYGFESEGTTPGTFEFDYVKQRGSVLCIVNDLEQEYISKNIRRCQFSRTYPFKSIVDYPNLDTESELYDDLSILPALLGLEQSEQVSVKARYE